ncbi:2-succinyl-6-hydroxy-2,4-cyclohexadiene-1-carboxylate synthase [compost metagenome]
MDKSRNAPVIFINGLIGILRNPAIYAALGGRPSLAPDLLGYGCNRRTEPTEICIPAQVDFLQRQVSAHFGTEPVHLVGHSVGGVIACQFAQRYPERVFSVINVEGNFTLKDAFWSAGVARMSTAEVEEVIQGFISEPQAWLSRSGIPALPHYVDEALAWLKHQPGSTLKAMAESVVVETGNPYYLTSLRHLFARCPVHLMAGERSITGWDIPDWGRQTSASFTVMARAGHLMMLEKPAEFGRLVARLLDRELGWR